MKRRFILLLTVILVFVIVGCQPTVGWSTAEISKEGQISAIDYYPFIEGRGFEYEGLGLEFANQSTYFEFIEENKAQLKVKNSGTSIVKVIEYEDGILKETYTEGEFYHIENMINRKNDKENILIMEPIEVGTSWITEEGYAREITGIDVEIKTPFNTFEALEITTNYGEKRGQRDYYVKDVGPVASIYTDGEMQVKTLLQSIKDGSELLNFLAYYPRVEDMENVYLERGTKFYTNDRIEKIIENILRETSSEELIPLISQGTSINNIYLDRSNWVLNVDFSEELILEMNAGSTLEIQIIKSIVNTLGSLYDTDRVYITIENKPYESGHYGLQEGEEFIVDLEDAIKFN